jgi:CheY-like chemotaxis protein
MFIGKAKEKGIGLSASVNDSVPETLEGDATRLTQILVNLIGNALKFTKEGSIEVLVRGRGIKDNTINTIITVSDTGIGIEESKLKDIFNRFQQAENSVTRNYGGTGLGLSIVNELVSLQKGTIKAESERGRGSVFTVMIPYKIATDFPVVLPAKSGYLSVADNFEDTRILIVEDNEINQSLLKHLFSEWKLKFDVASNGKKAITKLKTDKYGLILMDIQMPEMDGYTATQEIRLTLKLETPIIAMTAHALAGEREKCLSYGMNEYISKPIREEQLYQLVSRFTRVKSPENKTSNEPGNPGPDEYKYINLQYMREISGGNKDYEKTVTEQFLEAIPEEIAGIKSSLQHKDISSLHQFAHNMRTTVSVMGLNEKLQAYLDIMEYENYSDHRFNEAFDSLQSICREAEAEARRFYSTL